MSQKTLTSTTDITELLSFPKEGDIVSGVKIVGVQTKFMDGKFGYRIVLPKTTRRADIPNLLRTFHTTQLITIDNRLQNSMMVRPSSDEYDRTFLHLLEPW